MSFSKKKQSDEQPIDHNSDDDSGNDPSLNRSSQIDQWIKDQNATIAMPKPHQLDLTEGEGAVSEMRVVLPKDSDDEIAVMAQPEEMITTDSEDANTHSAKRLAEIFSNSPVSPSEEADVFDERLQEFNYLRKKGMELFKSDNFEQAILCFESSIELYPENSLNWDSHLCLALCYLSKSEWEKCCQECKSSLIYEITPAGYFMLGLGLVELNCRDEGLSNIQKGIQLAIEQNQSYAEVFQHSFNEIAHELNEKKFTPN